MMMDEKPFLWFGKQRNDVEEDSSNREVCSIVEGILCQALFKASAESII